MNKLMYLALGLAAAGLLGPRLYTALRYEARIYLAADAPAEPVAIVFGAGLRRDGRPTAVLYDRVAAAAELYHRGVVGRLLLSGGWRSEYYSEPHAMQQLALEFGVPQAALMLDDAGHSTYDTCLRAQTVFGVSRALLVTQRFHLPRALFTCDALGIEGAGVAADARTYRRASLAFWTVREVLATANAWWQVTVLRPKLGAGTSDAADFAMRDDRPDSAN